jgi:Family of unknown function (DUF6412)
LSTGDTLVDVTWLGALWQVLGVLAEVGPAGLLAGTAAVASALLVAALAALIVLRRALAGPGPAVACRALRDRANRIGVPRHRDPDAAGRPRPRAPSAAAFVAA